MKTASIALAAVLLAAPAAFAQTTPATPDTKPMATQLLTVNSTPIRLVKCVPVS